MPIFDGQSDLQYLAAKLLNSNGSQQVAQLMFILNPNRTNLDLELAQLHTNMPSSSWPIKPTTYNQPPIESTRKADPNQLFYA